MALNSHTSGATGTGARDTGATGMLPIMHIRRRSVGQISMHSKQILNLVHGTGTFPVAKTVLYT